MDRLPHHQNVLPEHNRAYKTGFKLAIAVLKWLDYYFYR